LIPHGIPDVPFVDPGFHKDLFGVEGKSVLLSFGLLSPNKGIENVITALPTVLAKYPNVVYIVVGATHPHVIQNEGETYRLSLQWLAHEKGVEENVIFHNRFVSSGGTCSIHQRCGHLYHTISRRGADHLRHIGLHSWSWKSSHLHALLVCGGNAGGGTRGTGAISVIRNRWRARSLICWATSRNVMPCGNVPIFSGGI
jgi:glycosyltransferase involved in cell wall biosynthesis